MGSTLRWFGAASLAFGRLAIRATVRTGGVVLRVVAIPLALGISAIAAFAVVAFLPVGPGLSVINEAVECLRGISPGLVPEALGDPARLARHIHLGVAAFGGAVVLVTIRDLAKSIPNYWAFIKRPSFSELLQPSALAFIAFLGLAMSLFAVADVARERPHLELRFVANGLPYDARVDDALLRFYVVFPGEAGSATVTNDQDPSISIDRFFEPLLDRLVLDLASCIESDADIVELKVRGFASSSEWTQVEEKIPRVWIDANLGPLLGTRGVQTLPQAFNLWVADRRAANVVAALRGAAEKVDSWKRSHVTVEADPQTLRQMSERVGFADVSPRDGYSLARGLLTRRADIRLLQAGDCGRIPAARAWQPNTPLHATTAAGGSRRAATTPVGLDRPSTRSQVNAVC